MEANGFRGRFSHRRSNQRERALGAVRVSWGFEVASKGEGGHYVRSRGIRRAEYATFRVARILVERRPTELRQRSQAELDAPL